MGFVYVLWKQVQYLNFIMWLAIDILYENFQRICQFEVTIMYVKLFIQYFNILKQ
jgi:hypothetical protein